MSKFRQLAKISLKLGVATGTVYGAYNLYNNYSQQHIINNTNQNQGINSINSINSINNQVNHIDRIDHIGLVQNNKQSSSDISKQKQKENGQESKEQQKQVKNNVNKQQNKQQNKQKQQQVQQPNISSHIAYKSPNFSSLKSLSQLQQFSFSIPASQLSKAIIVSDIGFTQQFQSRLIQTIKNIEKLSSQNKQQIKIYRLNILDDKIKQKLKKQFNIQIKQQTIFLMKNQLDNNFINIDFDMYMQYPSVINAYLKDIQTYNLQNKQKYHKMLQKMSPNQTYLIHVYDNQQGQEKKKQRFLAAKYIQMQLALNHLDTGIKVIPVQSSLLKQSNLINPSTTNPILPNSLHLFRKHNQFTHSSPNIFLHSSQTNQLLPYHIISDIGLHNKKGDIAIQNYLSKIETFNSMSFNTPFVLSVTVDKNRITVDNYKQIMNVFKEIRRNNMYPQIGLAFKFADIGYLGNYYNYYKQFICLGKQSIQNNQFCIKLTKLAQIQNQSYLHQIKTQQQLKSTQISQSQWLKQSYQYLYPHQIISQQLIYKFIKSCINNNNQIPQYYRSDKPSHIQNIHKIVANTFKQQIINNQNDHFVFEYSDNCPTCKMISPLIAYMDEVLKPTPVQERFDIHVLNSQKNRIKEQMYSPYTPNLHYYKKQWKQNGPVRIPLELLSTRGLQGIFNFCIITKMLKNIDQQKFNSNIQNAKKWNKSQFLL